MKKVKLFLLAACLLVTVGVMLAACHTGTFSADWTADADAHWRACEDEGCTEITDKAVHTWNEGEITTAATCIAEGVRTYTCTVCETTRTEPVALAEHTYASEWTQDEGGHWHVCEEKGCTAIADKANHAWNAGEVTTVATCIDQGEKTYTCTACAATKTEPIPVVPHIFASAWTRDEGGHWHACEQAGCTAISERDAHSWNEGTLTAEPSQEVDGIMVYTCTVCTQTKEKTVAYTGMTEEEWNAAFAPSLFENVTYTESATVETTGVSVTTVVVYRFTDDAGSVTLTYMGQSVESYITGEDYEEAKQGFVASLDPFTYYTEYRYDANTKTYQASDTVIKEFLGLTEDSEDQVTDMSMFLRFKDGKLVEINTAYTIVSTNGVILETTDILTFTDYGTTVATPPAE